MDLRKIKKLMELLEESGIAEIEVKEGEESIKLSRSINTPSIPNQQIAQQPIVHQQISSPQVPVDVQSTQESPKEEKGIQLIHQWSGLLCIGLTESKPFVTVGQSVKKGDTLCILEAMKMMNQVQAESDGKIIEILVDNAEPVEFDQPLFVIE